MNYYLGVDVGTSSVKSLLMDSEGKTVGTSQIGYDIIKEKLQYAEQDMEKLWEIFDERLELCHEALMYRHNRLKGTPSDVAPILWQNGALARLKKG